MVSNDLTDESGTEKLLATLPDLINHGLSALHDTLQQDKHLSIHNTSIAIIGQPAPEIENIAASGAAKRGNFRVWENMGVDVMLRAWRKSRGEPEDGPSEEKEEPKAEEAQTAEGSEQVPAEAPAAAPAGEDVEMQE
jgi:20S proteasome subunit alpha 6